MSTWINTHRGEKFYPLEPTFGTIHIEDIAAALSKLCRFCGHTKKFYSVAQHSVLVSRLCDAADAKHGLLHDAAEAYVNDLARPLKRHPMLEGYVEAERNLQGVIFNRFGLMAAMPPSVKEADNRLVLTEARQLLPNLHPDWCKDWAFVPYETLGIIPLSPEIAETMFLQRFHELFSDDGVAILDLKRMAA
jgi:uncharacterized protein